MKYWNAIPDGKADKWEECVLWMRSHLKNVEFRESDFVPVHESLSLDWQEPKETPIEPMFDILKRKCTGEGWFVGHHFSLGMWLRNCMRSNVFGEADMGVDNLDDFYIPLLDRALADA